MNTRIVGIVAPAGSGKSTVAKHLVKRYGYERMSMAGPLKDMLIAMGAEEIDVNGPQGHRNAPTHYLGGRSWRFAMQTLGTEWGRKMVFKDLWTNVAQKRIVDHITMANTTGESCPGIVVDDIRFPNEWRMIEALGGEVWRVVRPGYGRLPSWLDTTLHHLFNWHPFLHESEYHWSTAPVDVEFLNDGTQAELLADVDEHMRTL
jgi:hypothetical protein